MCGIVGIFNFSSRTSPDERVLHRMCNAIRHRGPDDEGFYIQAPVGLGMRRLSVIDLTTGHQPIHNEDKTLWIVFNGEIYNFQSLRNELESEHNFTTATDTEVILHLYEKYGTRCVTRLRGMFAFAIWDEKNKSCLWPETASEKNHSITRS